MHDRVVRVVSFPDAARAVLRYFRCLCHIQESQSRAGVGEKELHTDTVRLGEVANYCFAIIHLQSDSARLRLVVWPTQESDLPGVCAGQRGALRWLQSPFTSWG